MTAEGKTPVAWNFSTMPSEDWKNGVGSALTAYAAGTGSWDDVVTAFVDGWATESCFERCCIIQANLKRNSLDGAGGNRPPRFFLTKRSKKENLKRGLSYGKSHKTLLARLCAANADRLYHRLCVAFHLGYGAVILQVHYR